MDIITTSLSAIRAHSPCASGYRKLVTSLGGANSYGMDTPITFRQIYESNGYDDTLWGLRAVAKQFDGMLRPVSYTHLTLPTNREV